MDEVWIPVNIDCGRYADRYDVSDCGRVRASLHVRVSGSKPGRIIFQSKDTKGYPQVIIYCGKPHTVKVHRLVATAFIGAADGMTVNHIDGDKSNNCLTNLEYISNMDNARHAVKHIRNAGFWILGEYLTLAEAVAKHGAEGVTEKAARRRIYRHLWIPTDAITTPIGRTGRPQAHVVAARQRQSPSRTDG